MEITTEYKYISKIYEYRISRVGLRYDGIMHIDIKSNELFTADDYKDVLKAVFEVGHGQKFLNLITIGKFTTADHDSRELSTSLEGGLYKLADAFVIQSLSQKLVANFYMNFHKPSVPTRFFNSEVEALEWLKQQKQF